MCMYIYLIFLTTLVVPATKNLNNEHFLLLLQCKCKYEIEIARLLAVKINIDNKEIIVINIYGPNKDNITLFQKLDFFKWNN